jgi:hypothetical protein
MGFDEGYAAYPYELAESKRIHADAVRENLGILCFTEDPREPLLWAHYADKHQGIALEFLTSSLGSISNVIYSKQRPRITPRTIAITEKVPDAYMHVQKLVIRYKAENWAYEREWRQLVNLNTASCEASGGVFRVPMPEGSLSRIIIGARCNTSKIYVKRAIAGKTYAGVPIVKAVISDSEFRVDMDLEDQNPIDASEYK